MNDYGKLTVIPHVPFIEFANGKISEENWVKKLEQLRKRPFLDWPTDPDPVKQEQASRTWEAVYRGMGFPLPWELWNIYGPEQVREIQKEFRRDLERLVAQREQDATWLLNKIQGVIGGEKGLLMQLHRSKPRGGNVPILATDPIYFVPILTDPHLHVYFRLAKLWEAGLLPRIGRCPNPKCEKFFLAKTQKETVYCSQRCAQDKGAAARTKGSRSRRATWTRIQKDLERAMEQMRTLQKTTERKALTQGEAILQKAEHAFQDAYRRGEGPGYKEGKQLLTQASRQVKQLQKK